MAKRIVRYTESELITLLENIVKKVKKEEQIQENRKKIETLKENRRFKRLD